MAAHPLDPLSAQEMSRTSGILREQRGVSPDGWRITSLEAVDPGRAAVDAFEAGGSLPPRRARAVAYERRTAQTAVAVVDLDGGEIESWEVLEGVQPNVTVDEWMEADEVLRSTPALVQKLAERGVLDLDLVFFDTWTYGAALIPTKYAGRRVGWADIWVKQGPLANPYAGPVNGLHPVIDLGTMELLEIEDTFRVDRPEIMGEYLPRWIPERIRNASSRPPLEPLAITQPQGPSFDVDGNLITWQGWSVRVGFNYREGMTLHRVRYTHEGRERTIANKLSFAEMVVPYRDASPDHYRRTAFDIGEWGLGFMTTSLTLGCDCLGEIRYLDAVMHDSKGEPYTIENAICIHEEDDAVLWKHVDHDAGAEVRRSRRLVISFHVTVANYEYLVYWRFYQDGNIECEVRATGIMVVTHVAPDAEHPSGTRVDERTYAPFHQHFLVARLDLEIDGVENTVYRTETEALPISPENPYGLAITQRATPIETEGHDDYDWSTQRAWKVVNENVRNGLGTNVSYKLVPEGTFPSFFDPASPVFQRAQVIGHTVWVTPNDPEERWPAGEFVNQSSEDLGLPAWTRQGRGVRNTDLVLWYVFGIHHITRPEEWPVMAVDKVSFWLKPSGFFDRNPALDVAPAPTGACGMPGHEGGACTCAHTEADPGEGAHHH